MPSSLSHRDIQRKRREINTRGWTGGRDRGRASFLVAIVAAAAVDSSFLSSSKRTISRWKFQVLFYSSTSTVSIAPTEWTLSAGCVESCMRAEKRERCLLDRRTKKKKTLNFLTSLCFGVVKGKKKRQLNRQSLPSSRENDARQALCPFRPPGVQRRQSGLLHRDRESN